MSYQQDTIDRVREIMAPGNPVPDAARAVTESRGPESTLSWIIGQAPTEPGAGARRQTPRLDGRPSRPRRPAARVVTPLAGWARGGRTRDRSDVRSPVTEVASPSVGRRGVDRDSDAQVFRDAGDR